MWSTLILCLTLVLEGVRSTELQTSASERRAREYNHRGLDTRQYLEEVEPTRKGPVLFPNDAPPPPRPPLVVTSRPLPESIARSELNPDPQTTASPERNNVGEGTRVNTVYRPRYQNPVTPTPLILVNAVTGRPVHYEGFLDYGVGKVQVLRRAKPHGYQVKEPVYSNRYETNHIDDNQGDLSQNSDYAFSYKVKDQATGDDFSHSQQSSGSATNGEYRVRLPDGRMQIVSYTADENGYKADVRYDDEDKVGNTGNIVNDRVNQFNYGKADNNVDYVGNNIKYDYNVNNDAKYKVNRVNYVGSNDGSFGLNVDAANDAKFDYNVKNDYNVDYGRNADYSYNEGNSVNYDNRIYDNDRQFYKPSAPVKEEYLDESKDYDNIENDYSVEYKGKYDNYEPHRTKFNTFAETNVNEKQNLIVVPNEQEGKVALKPSIEDLRNLFLHRKPIPSTQGYSFKKIPVEINVPSTTPRTNSFESSTEHVVIIGSSKPNLYTNVRSTVATPVTTPAPVYQRYTPSQYLASTVSALRNVDLSGPKPVLSNSFIDRINRYLTYK